MRILQAYVNDLSEQNDVLVSTLEELEKEARERVSLLEKELKKASTSSKVRSNIRKISDWKIKTIYIRD